MKELNEEINLTINMMQDGIYEGALNELQHHLVKLLEIKRNEIQKSLNVEYLLVDDAHNQPTLEMIDTLNGHGEDKSQGRLEYLVDALEKIAGLELASTDDQTEFSIGQDRWVKFCEAKAIAKSAIEQYRNANEELKAGGELVKDGDA